MKIIDRQNLVDSHWNMNISAARFEVEFQFEVMIKKVSFKVQQGSKNKNCSRSQDVS